MKNKNIDESLILEDYESEFSFKKNKSNLNITFNRIAFIFFVFFIICTIYSIKILYLGSLKSKIKTEKNFLIKKNFRSDIIDSSGDFIGKSVYTQTVGINPNLIIDEKKLLINLKLIFPNKNFEAIKNRIKKKKYFRLQRELTQMQVNKIRLLGDKSIKFEEQITRLYPQKNLFSHVIGQIDDNNNGISGIEKFFDYELKTTNEPLKLTLDKDIQFLIRDELIKFQTIFNNIGSTSILMNINNGEILSMVSLPDFNLNKRQAIKDVNYINRATKGVYELGSVFKTFTVAAGLNEGLIDTKTEFLNLEKKLKCGKNVIREYDNKIPSDLTVEQILIRSGNIGSVRIGQKLEIDSLKSFLEKIGVLNKINFDLEEIGKPIPFKWGKCKLATVSFGHGITTTPLQLAKAYAIISNGGYEIKPTLVKKKNIKENVKKKILKEGVSEKINLILRKIVTTKEGTAGLANVPGYEVGGKTGTAQKTKVGGYSKAKVNTFVAVFPISEPKYVLVVLLDEPKISKEYVYNYRNKKGSFKGTPFNTAGWTSVEVAGKIIEKIGPILATKYIEVN